VAFIPESKTRRRPCAERQRILADIQIALNAILRSVRHSGRRKIGKMHSSSSIRTMSKGMAEKARGNAAPNICTRILRLPGGLAILDFQGRGYPT